LKGGVNGLLNTLTENREQRVPIIITILLSHEWTLDQATLLNRLLDEGKVETIINELNVNSQNVAIMNGISQFRQNGVLQLFLGRNIWGDKYIPLNELRLVTPGFIGESNVSNVLTDYIDTKLETLGYLVNGIINTLDDLPSTKIEREPIIDALLKIPDFWGTDQIVILEALRTPNAQEDEGRIRALNGFVSYLVNGITATLDDLPSTQIEREPIIDALRDIPNFWGTDQIGILEALSTPDTQDQDRIDALKGFVSGFIGSLTGIISTLSVISTLNNLPEERESIIDALLAITNFWGTDQILILEALSDDPSEEDDPGRIGALNEFIIDTLLQTPIWGPDQIELLEQLKETTSPIVIQILVEQLTLYVTGILKKITILNDGVRHTVATIGTETNPIIRGIIITILLQFPIWGPDQINLLEGELRVVGSQNHAERIDEFVNYLDDLQGTAGASLGPLFNLLTITNDEVYTGAIDSLLTGVNTPLSPRDTLWGGYFINLLDELKDPAIVAGTEESNIVQLKAYIEIKFFTETENNNIEFLLRQLTVQYPEPIFNKWVRGKKHVPLMYSKQRLTGLTCDGTEILGETTGTNLFLSACLPNLYHKRTPNFRNINMYSFALYPSELRPSGHLNFSTIKDAYVNMELEYDGRHGTFDFDDNFIELFGIPRIDFPKQVIIIAKSYNMMIIRNGKAHILFTS
jgi:hypothetical protein